VVERLYLTIIKAAVYLYLYKQNNVCSHHTCSLGSKYTKNAFPARVASRAHQLGEFIAFRRTFNWIYGEGKGGVKGREKGKGERGKGRKERKGGGEKGEERLENIPDNKFLVMVLL